MFFLSTHLIVIHPQMQMTSVGSAGGENGGRSRGGRGGGVARHLLLCSPLNSRRTHPAYCLRLFSWVAGATTLTFLQTQSHNTDIVVVIIQILKGNTAGLKVKAGCRAKNSCGEVANQPSAQLILQEQEQQFQAGFSEMLTAEGYRNR